MQSFVWQHSGKSIQAAFIPTFPARSCSTASPKSQGKQRRTEGWMGTARLPWKVIKIHTSGLAFAAGGGGHRLWSRSEGGHLQRTCFSLHTGQPCTSHPGSLLHLVSAELPALLRAPSTARPGCQEPEAARLALGPPGLPLPRYPLAETFAPSTRQWPLPP